MSSIFNFHNTSVPDSVEKIFTHPRPYSGELPRFDWNAIGRIMDKGSEELKAQTKQRITENFRMLHDWSHKLEKPQFSEFFKLFRNDSDMMRAAYDYFREASLRRTTYGCLSFELYEFSEACLTFDWGFKVYLNELWGHQKHLLLKIPFNVFLETHRTQILDFIASKPRDTQFFDALLEFLSHFPTDQSYPDIFEIIKLYVDSDTRLSERLTLGAIDTESLGRFFAHTREGLDWLFETLSKNATRRSGMSSSMAGAGRAGAGAGRTTAPRDHDPLISIPYDCVRFRNIFGHDPESAGMRWLFTFLVLQDPKTKYKIAQSDDFFMTAAWLLKFFPSRREELTNILYLEFQKTQNLENIDLRKFEALFSCIEGPMAWLFENIKKDPIKILGPHCRRTGSSFFDIPKTSKLFIDLFARTPGDLNEQALNWLNSRFTKKGAPQADITTDPLLQNYALQVLHAFSFKKTSGKLIDETNSAHMSVTPSMMLNWVLLFLGRTLEEQNTTIQTLQDLGLDSPEEFQRGINRIAQTLSPEILEKHGLSISIDFLTKEQKDTYMANALQTITIGCGEDKRNAALLDMLDETITVSVSHFFLEAKTSLECFSSFPFKPVLLNTTHVELTSGYSPDPSRHFIQATIGENKRNSEPVRTVRLDTTEGDTVIATILNEFEQPIMTISAPQDCVSDLSAHGTKDRVFFPSFRLALSRQEGSENLVYGALGIEGTAQVKSTGTIDVSYKGVESRATEEVVYRMCERPSACKATLFSGKNMTVTTYNPQTGDKILTAFYEDVTRLDRSAVVPDPRLCHEIELHPCLPTTRKSATVLSNMLAAGGAGAGAGSSCTPD